MNTLEKYKKQAKSQSKSNGTSHQSELNKIAREKGYANWGAMAAALTSSHCHLGKIPGDPRELEQNLSEKAYTILTPEFDEISRRTLAALLLIETLRASKEGRPADLKSLRDWLGQGLEEASSRNRRDKETSKSEGRFYDEDPERDWIEELAAECHEARPYGWAYAQMKCIAAMAPSKRINTLMVILPALSDKVDDLLKAA